MDLYARIRRACQVEGLSRREAASRFGVHRNTVRKILKFSVPPGYCRKEPAIKPKLSAFIGVIDGILEDDRKRPAKQRHTVKRIWERLKAEHGFTGGYTIVKGYVRKRTLATKEVFVPLVHRPGNAQADFGEALAVIGGVERKIHFCCVDLPHSDAGFVKAYPGETTEAFCDAHNAAFRFFGGVPRQLLYDNTKIAVARILGDGKRQKTRSFLELESHYLFESRFGRPGKGNDKGKVEGLVGYARRNFLVPVPRFPDFESLNRHLEAECVKRMGAKLRGHDETIGERFQRDLMAFLPLPEGPYDACEKVATRVSSLSLVRYRSNDYSVPVSYGHREVLVRGYVHEVVIACGAETIARHPRCYEREQAVMDPLHYLELIEKKTGSFDQAAPLEKWELPPDFGVLRRELEARMGKNGIREYVQVLRLMEHFEQDLVRDAVREALRLGAAGFDAVKHLVLCRIEERPPKLNLDIYPYLPRAQVETTKLSAYLGLLGASVTGSAS